MKTCTKCGEEKGLGEFFKRKDGHDGLNSQCKVCSSIKHTKWRERNKERLTAERKAEYAKDPEKMRKRSRDWRAKHPEKAKANSREAQAKQCRFKVALQCSRRAAKNGGYEPCDATIEELGAAFNGKCHLCGVPELELNQRLHLDHNHETREFRGWLCKKCNTGLGSFRDSEELLIDALHYVMNCKEKAKR